MSKDIVQFIEQVLTMCNMVTDTMVLGPYQYAWQTMKNTSVNPVDVCAHTHTRQESSSNGAFDIDSRSVHIQHGSNEPPYNRQIFVFMGETVEDQLLPLVMLPLATDLWQAVESEMERLTTVAQGKYYFATT